MSKNFFPDRRKPVHGLQENKLRRCRCWIRQLAYAAMTSLSLSGCAGFWDEVTSRNFKFSHLYEKPDPLLVLRDSTDGNERAKALRALREPKQMGGTSQDQDAVLNILMTAAVQDKQFLCRMAAIESLGKFQDPRAVDGLTKAFYNSGTFAPDMATRIQMQAATALGQTHQPGAEQFLVMIAKERPKTEGSDQEKQQNLDVRLAATRALGNYNDNKAAEVLQGLLKSERDVAMRDCAQDALASATGVHKPLIDLKPIGDWFRPAGTSETAIAANSTTPAQPSATTEEEGIKGKLMKLVGWFQPENSK
jgi:hypothetical protein